MLERSRKSGRRFLNPVETKVGGFGMIFKILPLYLSNKEERTPKVAPGPFRTDPAVYQTPPRTGLRVTWFGHSTTLIEIDGVRVLTDPVWDERASPFSWAGPKRFFRPTLEIEELPRLDVVLISHDHYDHLGRETMKRLARAEPARGARWMTPLGVGAVLRSFGVPAERIQELDWTESATIPCEGGHCMVTALPSRHFSGRGILNRFETLWASFVLRGAEHAVYYGADSGWWEGFSAIGAAYGPFDLTMLEIGAYNDLWRQIHMGPEGAVRAFEALDGPQSGQAGLLMPIHWGLFDLALHGWRQPIEAVTALAAEKGIRLWSPEPGRPEEVERGVELRSEWWLPR